MLTRLRPSRAARDALLSSLVLVLLCGCQAPPVGEPMATTCAQETALAGWRPPQVSALGDSHDFEDFIDALGQSSAVLVGEFHDRYDHHLTQLEIICRLHDRDPRLAIGIEFVQKPFQAPLDDYLAGRLDVDALLEKVDYYTRWGYDFRLYEPILSFARDREIPVIALNVAAEVSSKTSHTGIDSLSPEERAQVPAEIEPADERYLARMQAVFERHPAAQLADFEGFVTAQLLWDESMAERAALYLRRHSAQKIVVLAGNGHVAYRNAIPDRLGRRTRTDPIAVSQEIRNDVDNDADYRLISTELKLPPAGKLGVYMQTDEGAVRIESLFEDSAAQIGGLQEGDRILSLDGRGVTSYADVKIALWRKRSGDPVDVVVGRGDETLSYQVVLR